MSEEEDAAGDTDDEDEEDEEDEEDIESDICQGGLEGAERGRYPPPWKKVAPVPDASFTCAQLRESAQGRR